MTNFKETYADKLTTASEAVKHINAGEHIIYPITPAEPPMLHEALGKHESLDGNYLYRMLPTTPALDLEPAQLRHVSIFLSGADRKAYNQGNHDLLPNHFSDIPSLLYMRTQEPVIMATVSPMDEEGNFSLGTSNSYVGPLVKHAKTIILEVNENMPRTFGQDNTIHISEVTALVENTVDLYELPTPALSDKDLAIGQTIADLVKDGDTLQIGFGSMPNAVMKFLMEKKNLGLHTEMLPDKLVDMVDAGVLDNSKKVTFTDKHIATFAIGSKRLYDFMNNNEDLLMMPCTVTNDVRNIAQEDNLVAINSAVEVDFLGQCSSEKVQATYYSSTGGQADYTKGVRLTANGQGIICLYSTAKRDEVSTIVPTLFKGAAVTTSKNDIDTVVTEYGAAQLKGKTISERVEALIKIAHPKFRDELKEQALAMGYLKA